MTSSFIRFSAAFVTVLFLGLSPGTMSCTGGACWKPSSRSLQRQKSVLRVQLTGEPVSLDPSLAEDGLSLRLLSQMMDGLVAFDGAGELQNALAESYRVSRDGKRYEFVLKKKAYWSDGRPVDPKDFVIAFRRALKPDSGSKLAELLLPVKGARDYRSGKSSELPGIYEKDGKLVIELERPTPYFVQVLALPVAYPLREDVLNDNAGAWPVKDPPSTGPYKLAAYQPGKRFLLESNEGYWGGTPAISLVDFLIVQDESTGASLFESGQLDILSRVPTPDIPRFRKEGWLRQDPFLATYYLSFNTRKPPFNDRELRRAIAGVIHRDELVNALASGETPARSWVPNGLEGFITYTDPAPVFASSVRAARHKLSHRKVAASFDSGARNSMVMEKVQQDVAKGLGLELELTNLDWKSYISSIQTDPTPIFRMGWLAPIRDPIVHLQVFVSSNINNLSGWKNESYDRLVSEIGTMAPGPAREKKIRSAERILVDEEAAVIPLYHYVQNHAVAKRVRGFRVNPFGVFRVGELSFVPSK